MCLHDNIFGGSEYICPNILNGHKELIGMIDDIFRTTYKVNETISTLSHTVLSYI